MFENAGTRLTLTALLSSLLLLIFGTVAVKIRPTSVEAAGTIFVNVNVVGGNNNGNSWTDAYSDLQSALASATSGDEIWVAAGVYLPGSDVADSFNLKSGVKIYGGFNGTEGVSSQRSPTANVTVLSGDIDGNDTKNGQGVVQSTDGIAGTNSYHVVEGSGADATAILDGFTITAGSAIAVSGADSQGGGIYNTISSPTLLNLEFWGNQAVEGGAVYNGSNSLASLTSIKFQNNRASRSGGAVYNLTSDATYDSVVFTGNVAETGSGLGDGGAMYNWESDVEVSNGVFTQNIVDNVGGAVYSIRSDIQINNSDFISNSAKFGGAIGSYDNSTALIGGGDFSGNSADSGGAIYSNESIPTITDATFSNNEAVTAGGAVHNNENSPAVITRATFTENKVVDGKGGGLFNFNSDATLTNVSFQGNVAKEGAGAFNQSGSSATYTNALFTGNAASVFGGGMSNEESDATLINATFSGNTAVFNGGGLFNNKSTVDVSNTIFWNNAEGSNLGTLTANFTNNGVDESSGTFQNSIIQASGGSSDWDDDLGTDNGGNLDSDPLFKTEIDILTVPTTAGDFLLGSGSAAINSGLNLANAVGTDLAGLTRINEGTIEMGPYEVTTVSISVTVNGNGVGTVNGPGLACSADCNLPGYVLSDTVTLSADPDPGYTFLGWSGDCSGTDSCTLTMDASKSVTAEFGIDSFDLQIFKSNNGVGTVSSADEGIDCGLDCEETYLFQTEVTLTAEPDISSTFDGWSGACTGLSGCTVAITQTRTVTAEFTLKPITVTVAITKSGVAAVGQGTVTSEPAGISCNFDCTEVYNYGTELTLTPNPELGTTFTGWTGDCTGNTPCVVTLTEDLDVQAEFTKDRFTLTVNKAGFGSGQVLSDIGAIFCGETCTAELDYGTVIKLVPNPDAKPNETITFAGWRGDCTGTDVDGCVLTMDAHKSVTVLFDSDLKQVYLPLVVTE